MGLLKTAAAVAVASSVHGRVQRRQQSRWAPQDRPHEAMAATPPPPPQCAAPPPPQPAHMEPAPVRRCPSPRPRPPARPTGSPS